MPGFQRILTPNTYCCQRLQDYSSRNHGSSCLPSPPPKTIRRFFLGTDLTINIGHIWHLKTHALPKTNVTLNKSAWYRVMKKTRYAKHVKKSICLSSLHSISRRNLNPSKNRAGRNLEEICLSLTARLIDVYQNVFTRRPVISRKACLAILNVQGEDMSLVVAALIEGLQGLTPDMFAVKFAMAEYNSSGSYIRTNPQMVKKKTRSLGTHAPYSKNHLHAGQTKLAKTQINLDLWNGQTGTLNSMLTSYPQKNRNYCQYHISSQQNVPNTKPK